MNRQRSCLAPISLACETLAPFFVSLTSALAGQSPAIDYDNVNDILNGQHSLLQMDDLVLIAQDGDNSVSEAQYNTSNSGVASVAYAYIAGTRQKKAGPAASANMFRTGGPVLIQ